MSTNPIADETYIEEAQRRFADAVPRISDRAKDCLRAAHASARELDTDHVGTEHVIVGLFDAAPEVNAALRSLGITRRVFVSVLEPEEGHFPEHGVAPETPRALAIVGFADRRANGGPIDPCHLALGVVDESRHWRALGNERIHHLYIAAEAAGTHFDEVEAAFQALLA